MRELLALFVIGASILGCAKDDGPPQPSADAKSAHPTPATTQPAATQPATSAAPAAAQPATPAPTVAAAPTTGYPLDAITPVPDNCSSPWVILATAPTTHGNPTWAITRQALLANQQFRVVAEPSAPSEVSLSTYAMDGEAAALVSTCKDGGTCNQLAAMYKAIVRSSKPQVGCGPVRGVKGKVETISWEMGKDGVPAPSDTIGQCARLNACMIATDRTTPGDPFLECQRAPSKFKLKCAQKYPCADVLACAQE